MNLRHLRHLRERKKVGDDVGAQVGDSPPTPTY